MAAAADVDRRTSGQSTSSQPDRYYVVRGQKQNQATQAVTAAIESRESVFPTIV